MKKVITIFALFGVLAFAAVAQATLLKVDPAAQEVMQGATFDVEIYIDNLITNCGGIAFKLNFDASAMQGGVPSDEGFLGSVLGVYQVDNTAGEATYAATQWPKTGGVSGSGLLSTITFTVDESAPLGTYDLTFSQVEFREPDSPYTLIPIDTVSGSTVTVVPEPATMCLLALGGLLLRRKKNM